MPIVNNRVCLWGRADSDLMDHQSMKQIDCTVGNGGWSYDFCSRAKRLCLLKRKLEACSASISPWTSILLTSLFLCLPIYTLKKPVISLEHIILPFSPLTSFSISFNKNVLASPKYKNKIFKRKCVTLLQQTNKTFTTRKRQFSSTNSDYMVEFSIFFHFLTIPFIH